MQPRRGSSLWLLIFALLSAQSLGLLHRITHGAQLHASSQPPHQAHDQADPLTPSQPSLLDTLFGHHQGVQCQLFDQLTHGDTLPTQPALMLPVVLSFFWVCLFIGSPHTHRRAAFDARGPPRVR